MKKKERAENKDTSYSNSKRSDCYVKTKIRE